MLPLLENVVNGYNATLFAYGMTGAGKTHTLFGELNQDLRTSANTGIIFLTINDLLNLVNSESYSQYEFSIKVSYLEIYNEQVRDLLSRET